jgi:response regulator RpfG family c-di-GMP phosphodiesterase
VKSILIIEGEEGLAAAIDGALSGLEYNAVEVDSIDGARRSLIQQLPDLVCSRVSIAGDESAGFGFCSDLQNHPELSQVPVVLIGDELNEEQISKASESGAIGFLSWPVSEVILRNRVRAIIPDLKEASAKKSAVVEKPKAAPTVANTEVDEKFQLVQDLLAQLLHNLKTSALLDVVETEDVPQVVYEMCRKVCGISESAAKPVKKEPDVTMDLENAFGMKK